MKVDEKNDENEIRSIRLTSACQASDAEDIANHTREVLGLRFSIESSFFRRKTRLVALVDTRLRRESSERKASSTSSTSKFLARVGRHTVCRFWLQPVTSPTPSSPRKGQHNNRQCHKVQAIICQYTQNQLTSPSSSCSYSSPFKLQT